MGTMKIRAKGQKIKKLPVDRKVATPLSSLCLSQWWRALPITYAYTKREYFDKLNLFKILSLFYSAIKFKTKSYGLLHYEHCHNSIPKSFTAMSLLCAQYSV